MESAKHLFLVDSNSRRRAAISHMLVNKGVHAEPFESSDEIGRRWPDSGVILIEDTGRSVTQLVERMSAAGEWLPVIALRENPSTHQVAEAIREGAVDYLAWPCDAEEIALAVEAALASASQMAPLRLREARARNRIQRLTPREREVLSCVADGLSNRRIGQRLAISPRTVEIHRANLLHKIGANHTSDAIRMAIEAELHETARF